MGTATPDLTMAALIILLLAVAVSGVGAVGTGRVAVVPHGSVYSAAVVPGVHGVPVVPHTGLTYTATYPYTYLHGRRKREAEPYTIHQVNAGLPVADAIATGHPHNVGVVTNAALGVYSPYSHYPYTVGYTHHYGKREAEPQVYGVFPYHSLGALGHVGVANTGLGHAVAATPFGLTHSANVGICTNYVGARVPC